MPSTTAIALGLLLTAIISAVRRVAGSIREMVPSVAFATHTPPSPAAIALGSRRTLTMSVTASVAGSTRETVAAWRFAVHNAPSPTATSTGPLPTAIVFTHKANLGHQFAEADP